MRCQRGPREWELRRQQQRSNRVKGMKDSEVVSSSERIDEVCVGLRKRKQGGAKENQ